MMGSQAYFVILSALGALQCAVGNYGRSNAFGDCECVPYYLCANNGVITDGVNSIKVKFEGSCKNDDEICCKTSFIKKRMVCGKHNPEGLITSISSKTDAKLGEFPWMAAILSVEQKNGRQVSVYQCGGALIHPQVVLTAAHCVKNSNKTFKVRLGEWNAVENSLTYPHQERLVEKITKHPDFNGGPLFNDIALLILRNPAKLEKHVDIACLPPQDAVYNNMRCFSGGWGKDKFGKTGEYSVILKKIEVPLVGRNECKEKLRRTRLGAWFILDDSFICAGGEYGVDTCRGDGGSPLVCPIPGSPGRYQVVGLVAWGIGCGNVGVPAVYVNVPMFRNWINRQMELNRFESAGYNY